MTTGTMVTPGRPAVRAEMARLSLSRFVRQAWAEVLSPGRPLAWGWYLDAICAHLEAVTRGDCRRLIVTQPPNTLKSTVTSVCWPAWVWATDPRVRFLTAANDGTLATRDAVAMRDLVQSDWYQSSFRPAWRVRPGSDQKTYYANTAGGHRLAVSVNGAVTGKKGDVVLVDDPDDARRVVSPAERAAVHDWYDRAYSGRVADEANSPLIVVGQRLHPDDLIGHLVGQPGWTQLRLAERYDPARRLDTNWYADPRTEAGAFLRPGRFGETEWADRVARMGRRAVDTQHNQHPQHSDETWFPRHLAAVLPAVPAGTRAIRFWDTASTMGAASCDTAGVLMGVTPTGSYGVLDVVVAKLLPAARDALIVQTAHLDRARTDCRVTATCVERPAGVGIEVSQNIVRLLAGFNAKEVPVGRPKDERIQPFAAQWQVGNVWLLAGAWNARFLDEHEAMPGGSARDISDAAGGAFNELAAWPASAGAAWATAADASQTNTGYQPADLYR